MRLESYPVQREVEPYARCKSRWGRKKEICTASFACLNPQREYFGITEERTLRWATMDEAFGKDTALLDRIAAETPYHYFAEIPTDTRLWWTRPATRLPARSGRGAHRPLSNFVPASRPPPLSNHWWLLSPMMPSLYTHSRRGAKG
ncbi:hypothetical protein KFU94_54610 [Chloroflexi bacterium TSY]|nr:hypothetical protein [Chloroflexi bacterium TSY]